MPKDDMPSVSEKHDFDALRAKRNAAVEKMVHEIAEKHGFKGQVHSSFDPNACYCDCINGGPCEHDFRGWRDITDGDGNVCGGETFCQRCGMGSMSHSLHCCDF